MAAKPKKRKAVAASAEARALLKRGRAALKKNVAERKTRQSRARNVALREAVRMLIDPSRARSLKEQRRVIERAEAPPKRVKKRTAI